MRRVILAVAILAIGVSHAAAQEKSKVALRLEAKQEADGVRITVFIENLTEQPVKMRDPTNPPFMPWPFLKAKVDGKDADLQARAAFAQQSFRNAKEETIDGKKRFTLGSVMVAAHGSRLAKDEALVPVLYVEPGTREIQLGLKHEEVQALTLGKVAPASVKITVQLADAPAKTYTYKTVGELPIKADVYRLMGDEVRPVIVWIHGGALISGTRNGSSAEQRRRYLDAGFVVVSIDYRLAPETKLKGIIEDVQDAFKWVRESGPHHFKIDPKRVGVVGHSAGGYLTLMSGFTVEPRPQALVPFYGYGDITNEWYSKPDPFYLKQKLVTKEEADKAVGTKETTGGPGRGKFYLYCRQNGLWPKEVAGFDPEKEPRAFDRFCPIRNVTKEYPPTLLLHGDKDTDVPHQQSVDMAAELKKHGVVHDFISIKNGSHGFDGAGMKDAKVAAAFDQVIAFLKKHTAK